MEAPTWGDIIQAATTIAVAAIFGHLIVRRLKQQDAFHHKLEGELSRIVDFARSTETRVAGLYRTAELHVVYAEIQDIIYTVDNLKRTYDIIRTVMTPKMDDLQLPLFTEFDGAFNRFFVLTRKLDTYFDANGSIPTLNATLDLREPIHRMFESLTRIIVRV